MDSLAFLDPFPPNIASAVLEERINIPKVFEILSSLLSRRARIKFENCSQISLENPVENSLVSVAF